MEHAIVTGATGFIGRWLISGLLNRGISVTAVIRPNSKHLALLPVDNRLTIVECPMSEYKTLQNFIPKRDRCVFYHLAWAGVSGPERVNLPIQLSNIEAAVQSVTVASQLGCIAYVGLGSIMEIEAVSATNTDEARPGMGYLYGDAKHFAHLATKAQAAKMNLSHLWPMLTNAYGEYEYSARFINSTLRKMLRNEPLEFTAGTQNYDFIHVEDVARALIAIGQKGKPFHSYIIGSGKAAPLRSFIEEMGRSLAPEQPLLFGNVPYTGVQLSREVFSIKSLQKDTEFTPQISFEDGIKRTMNWLRKAEEI
jgi:nucleoside-diphosphate-sugar epimerase